VGSQATPGSVLRISIYNRTRKENESPQAQYLPLRVLDA
jgi:hypothetical protein